MADAKSKWDYLILTAGSEVDLAKQMNHAGHEGWELVNGFCSRDAKGVATWSAFLRRVSEVPPVKGPTSDTAKLRAAQGVTVARPAEPAAPPSPPKSASPAQPKSAAASEDDSDFDLQL